MTLETALLIACTALSAIAVALLVFLSIRRRRDNVAGTDAARRLDAAIGALETKLNGADVLKAEHLTPIGTAVANLGEQIARVGGTVDEIAATPLPAAGDPVALEREVLAESWKQFRANRELSGALDAALQDRAWGALLDQLTTVVPSDLQPTFESVMDPCREHRTLVRKMELIQRVVSGNFPRLASDAAEVHRTRELAGLLAADATSRLDFRFKSWVTDTFLPFADLYLQRYQETQPADRNGELQTGVTLVRQVLRIAAVEPIDVTPGETPFDSTRHIGRTTSNDPRFSDGVITGVVRNGFIEGGQQVIRQPEVVVNRLR